MAATEPTLLQSIVLAILQGLTEFLPVSSSAHLILLSKQFDWPDQGLEFDIVLHLGTLLALLLYYKKELIVLLKPPGWKYLWFLFLASLPVGIVGFVFKDVIALTLRGTATLAWSTLLFGLLLGLSEWYAHCRKSWQSVGSCADWQQTRLKHWLWMGCAQVFALIPGASRSGTTLTAGLFMGLNPRAAAQISFWMAGPVIVAAAGLGLFSWSKNPSALPWEYLGLGFGIAFITGYFCIFSFMRLLLKTGVWPFVIYRVFLGIYLLYE